MNNKTIIRTVLVVILAVVFGAVALASMKNSGNDMASDGSMMNGSGMENMNSEAPNMKLASNQVTYEGFDVVQKNITVKKGTTVTWTNEDNAKHDVTPEEETEEFKTSELFGKGETYSVTFNTVGKFGYYCSPHPYMKGTVEVTE